MFRAPLKFARKRALLRGARRNIDVEAGVYGDKLHCYNSVSICLALESQCNLPHAIARPSEAARLTYSRLPPTHSSNIQAVLFLAASPL